MGITVKYLMDLGIDEETAKKIFAERGKEIDVEKSKREELESKIAEKDNSYNQLNTEFEALKANNASAEDWKNKFETFKRETEEKEKAAKAEQEAKAKAAAIQARFEAVVGEKKFAHEAIKNDYLNKFSAALDDKAYTGKSDSDILHELTKDDAAAFVGVQAVHLEGGANRGDGLGISEAQARAIMGLPPTK